MNKLLSFSFLVLVSSCVRSEVTRTGKTYPPREVGCEVAVLPNTLPSFSYEEIATGEARCHNTKGRTGCIDKLRADACKYGAHAVFGFREGKVGEYHVITASFAHATGEPSENSSAMKPAAAPVEARDQETAATEEITETPAQPASREDGGKSLPSIEERLKMLADLKEKGLVTQEEYEARRTAILESI